MFSGSYVLSFLDLSLLFPLKLFPAKKMLKRYIFGRLEYIYIYIFFILPLHLLVWVSIEFQVENLFPPRFGVAIDVQRHFDS